MHVGILLADNVREEFVGTFGDYPEMFEAMLRAARPDLELQFSVFDVQRGHYPRSLDVCDGFVITGSRQSVYDPLPWIDTLGEFVRTLHEAKQRTVGVCFGHQLIAHALGGIAEAASAGWGVGVHTSRVMEAQRWMQNAVAESFNLLCSHKDQVTIMPPGARLVATSEFCSVAAFALGEHIITFQGHPEFGKSYAEALMTMRKPLLGPAYARGMASLNQPHDALLVGRWMLNFFGAPALVG